jgi:hypothetical protein
MKLNGWQRIGAIASVLWAIGAGISERNGQYQHSYMMSAQYRNSYCPSMSKDMLTGISNNDVFWQCLRDTGEENDAQLAFTNPANVASILSFSLLPIIVGWLLAYLSVRLFRWVRIGFAAGSLRPVGIAQAQPKVRDEVDSSAPAADPAPKLLNAEVKPASTKSLTLFWLALAAFTIAVVAIANKLIAQNTGVSPLTSLANLGTSLPILAQHPQAVMEYLAEAVGMALPIPLIHSGVALFFKNMRNPTSRRRIFIGWSAVATIVAMIP